MARDFFINGENMVWVKGSSASGIANLSELGLSEQPIRVSPEFRHGEITLSAWGNQIPVEAQFMLAAVNVTLSLIHFDRTIIDYCMQESMGGAPAVGTMSRAGTRLGNGAARFAAANHFIGLNIASPIAGKPWRFYSAFLTASPVEFPLGNERSTVSMTWRCIPYTPDPWNNGLGSYGVPLWDYVLDQ